MLAILPEGTRKRTPYWRSGFYHIALGAQVPIALGFADYRRKVGGIAGADHAKRRYRCRHGADPRFLQRDYR